MKAKITNELLNSIKSTGKTELIWDTSMTGFGVRVTPNGTASFIAQVREPGKPKPNPKTVGRVGEINLRDARNLARKMMSETSEDIEDDDIDLDSDSNLTFDQAWTDYICHLLIDHGLDPEKDDIPNRWPPDIMQKRVTYRRLAREGLAERKLSDITYKEINRYLQSARKRSESSALQTKNHLSSLYRFHCKEGNVQQNPLKNISGWSLDSEVYALTEDEAIALTNLLDQEIEKDPIPMSYVKFRMAVGGRVTDIAKLRWEDDGKHNCVNLQTSELYFREHKTKKKTNQNMTIALTDAGLRVLLEMKNRGLVHPHNPHIFWSDHRYAINGHIDTSNVQKKFRKLAERLAQEFSWSEEKKRKLTQYNLRHTFATLALDVAHMSIVDVKNQLMHKSLSTTMKYVDATKSGRDRVKSGMKKLTWM